ncbi:hypothetical protein CLCR_02288 [Cladophialophora carrionii]|uniref:Uncharacterized protein n=1 Tax=Cladophialophora carrionii TaxID=86049 RepID=A0A1C1CEJ7_9EURO|nr:hypothetical protein CLCR_02288 [Cladophialophora carrionii]
MDSGKTSTIVLGLPSARSTGHIRQMSATYSKGIFSCWGALRDILACREELIRKRWMKKTREQRKLILLSAWPEMPERHRPDFHELEKKKRGVKSIDTSALKWPYISQEDLLQGKLLLLFLNSRGRSPPSTFAHTDLGSTLLRQTGGINVPVLLRNHTMYIAGETKPENYGRLVSWSDDDSARILEQSGLQFSPGRGLLLLEIQTKVYSFLLECCYQLLHDVPRDELANLQLSEQPEPPAIGGPETSYTRISAVTAEAPYRLPAKLDTDRLVRILEARRAAAEDHLWDLREDPGYFAAAVVEESQHRREALLGVDGRRHRHDCDEFFWNRVIGETVSNAYMTFLTWDVLYNYTVALDQELRVGGDLDPRKPLPKRLETALVELSFAAGSSAQVISGTLNVGLPASPPIRDLFERQPQHEGSIKGKVDVVPKKGACKDPLLKLFVSLSDNEQLLLLRLPNVVDEMQRLIDIDAGQRARMTPWVARYFSDLALAAHIVRQVDNFYPWAAGFNELMNPEIRAPAFEKAREDLKTVYYTLNDRLLPRLSRIVVPFQENLHYPIDRAYDAENVDACRQAEAHLAKLWKTLDAHFVKHVNRTLHDIFLKHSVLARNIRYTPKLDSSAPEHSQTPGASDPVEDGSPKPNIDAEKPSVPVAAEISGSETNGGDTPQSPEQVPAIEPPNERPDANKMPTFNLGKRAGKVFSTIFHAPSENEQVGEISWVDFLHAMTAVGFVAERLYGSAWHFTPSKLGSKTSILIHEPHPSEKITSTMARHLRKRLSRTYGLTAESFKMM